MAALEGHLKQDLLIIIQTCHYIPGLGLPCTIRIYRYLYNLKPFFVDFITAHASCQCSCVVPKVLSPTHQSGLIFNTKFLH